MVTAWSFLRRVGVDPLPQLVLRHHDAAADLQCRGALAVNQFIRSGAGDAQHRRHLHDGQSSCRAMGAFQQWTLKQADDPVFKVYRREYKRRFAWIKAGRISDSEFYAWSEQAREQKKKCDEGIITAEDFQRWLKES